MNIINRLRSRLGRLFRNKAESLWRHDRAAVAIEFAAVAPIYIILIIGGIEYSQYLVAIQRVEKAAFSISNMVATSTPDTPDDPPNELTCGSLDDILGNFDLLMGDFPLDGGGRGVRVTSFQDDPDPDDNALLNRWSRIEGTPGPSRAANRINTVIGGGAEPLRNGENILVAEVYYRYEPLLIPSPFDLTTNIVDANIYRASFVSPRFENLVDDPC